MCPVLRLATARRTPGVEQLTIVPVRINWLPAMASPTTDHPAVCTLLTIHARVWARASSTTMRPIQRCIRLYVSNEMPNKLMNGLLRPARRNSGSMFITARTPVLFRTADASSFVFSDQSILTTQKAMFMAMYPMRYIVCRRPGRVPTLAAADSLISRLCRLRSRGASRI